MCGWPRPSEITLLVSGPAIVVSTLTASLPQIFSAGLIVLTVSGCAWFIIGDIHQLIIVAIYRYNYHTINIGSFRMISHHTHTHIAVTICVPAELGNSGMAVPS